MIDKWTLQSYCFDNHSLGVSHAVAVDELGERIAFTAVDTGRDLVLMHTELRSNVLRHSWRSSAFTLTAI